MIQEQNRFKNQTACTEGQISCHGNDNDSASTLNYNLNQDQNKSLKVFQKQKDKNQLFLEQATLRLLLHADRIISNEKTYFKFPKMDFYLNIDSLFSSINSKQTVDGSNISVINQHKKVKYTEISKKSNGIHIYMQNRVANEIPWQCMIERMKSYGNQEINELSDIISDFCAMNFTPEDCCSEYSCDERQDINSVFNSLSSKDVIDKIDDLFILNKNKPMIVWRGVNMEFISVSINECLMNQLQYTPEEFQMEIALQGIPEFVTSFRYTDWVKSIISVLTSLFSRKPMLKSSIHRQQKEFVTSSGQNITMDFEQYDLQIGNSELAVEMAVDEVKSLKKKPKKKQEGVNSNLMNEVYPGSQKNKMCLKVNEEKRVLSGEEKYFINNHYFKIQDFDFNKSKVCKYRKVTNETQHQSILQLNTRKY